MTLRPLMTLIAAGLSLGATAATAAELELDVTSIREPGGQIMVALHDADSWGGQGRPVSGQAVAVDGRDTVHLRFSDVPAGTYAVSLMHDANDNGEMDTNMVGVPTEGYGFSGGSAAMGRPSFEAASFELVDGEPLKLSIELR